MKDKQAENNDNVNVIHEQVRTRGGVSFVAVITGVVVAIGAFVVPPAVVGGILAALGVAEGGISPNEVSTAGIGLVIAQFLAYFWGGYTSGRMARGSGVMNGILVPIVAIILVVILGAVVAVATSSATDLRPSDQQLPLPLGDLGDIGTVVGIALLVAMLLAGALGGARGKRRHTKLEKRETA